MFYLALHLHHLSGKLDLCGVGELRVKRGGSSFNLRAIPHLRALRDGQEGQAQQRHCSCHLEITDRAQDHIPHKALLCSCVYLTLQLRHLQGVLYFWSVGELRVEGDRCLPLPFLFILFLNKIRSDWISLLSFQQVTQRDKFHCKQKDFKDEFIEMISAVS